MRFLRFIFSRAGGCALVAIASTRRHPYDGVLRIRISNSTQIAPAAFRGSYVSNAVVDPNVLFAQPPIDERLLLSPVQEDAVVISRYIKLYFNCRMLSGTSWRGVGETALVYRNRMNRMPEYMKEYTKNIEKMLRPVSGDERDSAGGAGRSSESAEEPQYKKLRRALLNTRSEDGTTFLVSGVLTADNIEYLRVTIESPDGNTAYNIHIKDLLIHKVPNIPYKDLNGFNALEPIVRRFRAGNAPQTEPHEAAIRSTRKQRTSRRTNRKRGTRRRRYSSLLFH